MLGPSGCGKTTTLRVMCGLERAEGFMRCCEEVFFDSERGLFLSPQQRRMGIVFQEDNLLPFLNVRENIEFALKKSPKKDTDVEELMERFGIRELEGKRPGELSGGEKQRVAIVRALAYSPRALAWMVYTFP
ncbi:MAG: ATP-binding cassette domain-containing protein [Aquificota bacterium]|nr:ATP-binding cassette domain-containing protein [Aquificota bacterium]